MKYLVKTTEVYRFDTDAQAQTFLEAEKADPRFDVKKTSCEAKEVKEKGEVIDEYIKVTIEKIFNAEKYPDRAVDIEYAINANSGGMPSEF